ncbi:MAG: prepilin-type N-terminal cleavage/methylation domain-containing protein [Phycisphaerales bacterium]
MPRVRNGFTLLEVMVVVVILGVLAAVVAANFLGTVDESKQSAFVSSIRTIRDSAVLFVNQTGTYPEDASSGTIPAGLDEYIRTEDWEGGTPIGGVWDFELNEHSLTSAFGVHFDGTGDTRDDAYMVQIDSIFDDGDLAAGVFRKIADDRYYYVLAE